jgi:membrane fusion protein, multidrug efflux system
MKYYKHFTSSCLLIISMSIILVGCDKKKVKPPPPKFPVTEKQVTIKDSPIFIETIGHVEPIESVELQARVEGTLEKVLFDEGQPVKKGDLLFVIDPRPYEAALNRAQALLQQHLAALQMAQDKLSRYTPLLKDEFVSEMDYDQLLTNVEELRAVINQDEAEIDDAKVNLDYCFIHSPITGKTGILQVKLGNMITPGSNQTLSTVTQIAPIYIQFAVPEKLLPSVQKYNSIKNLDVVVTFTDFLENKINGSLVMIDNTVNKGIGMIQMRGLFENEDKTLWPGKFTKVRLILTIKKDAIVVPFEAVQLTTQGPIIFVIKKDKTVALRHVTLGQREDDNIIVEKGVNPNEHVVISGQLNLSDGAHIYIHKESEEEIKDAEEQEKEEKQAGTYP